MRIGATVAMYSSVTSVTPVVAKRVLNTIKDLMDAESSLELSFLVLHMRPNFVRCQSPYRFTSEWDVHNLSDLSGRYKVYVILAIIYGF